MSTTEQEECPICYMPICDDINVCVTACKHKFHTGCLVLCGHICPMCRTNMATHLSASEHSRGRVLPGTYEVNEYLRQLEINNIPLSTIPHEVRNCIEENHIAEEEQREFEEKQRQNEEQRILRFKNKLTLQECKLFYGK